VHAFSDPQTQSHGQASCDEHTQNISQPLPKIERERQGTGKGKIVIGKGGE